MPCLKGFRIHVVTPIPIPTWPPHWKRPIIAPWIATAGGTLLPSFDPATTTHAIVDEKFWRSKPDSVLKILEAVDEGADIKIVSPEWLRICMENSGCGRVPVKEFLWEKIDEASAIDRAGGQKRKGGRGKKAAQAALGAEDDDQVEEVEAPKKTGHMALLGQAFEEATEPFVDLRQKKKLEAQIAGEEKAKRELEAEEERKKKDERLAAAALKRQARDLVRRGLKKGAAELFSDNHHIYTDHAGFSYDVTLTKVDTHRNRNERLVLIFQIFESNAFPHTYATNLHSAGTGLRAQNNILAALGTPFATAFAKFRKAFREQTGLEWDQRISGHNERVLAKQAGRAGKEGNEGEETWFRYQPPACGPKGVLEGVVDEVPEAIRRGREGSARSGVEMQEPGQERMMEGMEVQRSNDWDFVETWLGEADGTIVEPRRGSSIVLDDIRRGSEQITQFGGQDLAGQFTSAAEYNTATTAATVPETGNFGYGDIFNDPVFGNGQGYSGYQHQGQEYDFNFGDGEVVAPTGDQAQAACGHDETGEGLAPDQIYFGNREPSTNEYAYDNAFAPILEQQNGGQSFQQPARDVGPKQDGLSTYQASVHPASEPAQQPSTEFHGCGTGAGDAVAPFEEMDYTRWWSNNEAEANDAFPQGDGAQFADQMTGNAYDGDLEAETQAPFSADEETQFANTAIAQGTMDLSIPHAPGMSNFTGLPLSDGAGGFSFLDGNGTVKDGQTSDSQGGLGTGYGDTEGSASMLGKRKRHEAEKDGELGDGYGNAEDLTSELKERKSVEAEEVGEIAV